MGISLKIKCERKRLGLTQESLAEKLDVSKESVGRWEREEATPTLDNCLQLRNVLGVTLDYLLKDSIETKYKYDEYVKLGEAILTSVEEEFPVDFFSKYSIFSKESNMVLPKRSVQIFLSTLDDDEKRKDMYKITKEFLYKWYKFNKINYLLPKEFKRNMALLNIDIFSSDEIGKIGMKNDIYPEKPALFLRDLLLNRLEKRCNLSKYEDQIEDFTAYKLTLKNSNGEIFHPVSKYR